MYMRQKLYFLNRYNRNEKQQTNKQKIKKEKELQQISGYYKTTRFTKQGPNL